MSRSFHDVCWYGLNSPALEWCCPVIRSPEPQRIDELTLVVGMESSVMVGMDRLAMVVLLPVVAVG